MTKVAFYLRNAGIASVDCSNLDNGNPGIGGSQYAILLVARELYRRGNVECSLMAPRINCVLPQMPTIEAPTEIDAIQKSETAGFDYLVMSLKSATAALDFIKHYKGRVKLIVWCHNFVGHNLLNSFSKMHCIARLICVGREQMDLYLDNKAYLKSDYIYNAIPDSLIDRIESMQLMPLNQRANEVTYIGSIIPEKSFHVLAKAWPKVIKAIPDAVLNVIGSGKVYNRDAQMGKFGIAAAKYEDTFIKYITDEDKLLPSIKFHGILGEEKNDILLRTKVGIPNPTGESETFGFTAVEMQMFGAVVTTCKCAGYLDTVEQTNSVLLDSPDQLAESIINLLNSNISNNEIALPFIRQNFALSRVIEQWEKLIMESIPKNRGLNDFTFVNPDFEHKSIKLKLKKIKEKIPFGYTIVPTFHIFNRISSIVNLRR